MAQILTLSLPKNSKVLVEENDRVSQESILAKGEKEGKRETLSLSDALKIQPSDIFQVLVKKLGDKVKKGEILAKKGELFRRVVLKSPIDGRLVEISEALGEVILAGKGEKVVIKSPVSGKIKAIEDQEIKIKFEGVVFEGKRGQGERVSGAIENLPPDVRVLDLSCQIAKKILICRDFSRPVLAKSWALETAGLIGTNFSTEELALSFLVVDKKVVSELRGYQGKKAILEPLNSRLIILFDE